MVTVLALLLVASPDTQVPTAASVDQVSPAVSGFDAPVPDLSPSIKQAPKVPVRPAAVLNIDVAEDGAELAVTAEAPGWWRSCAEPVTSVRPCRITPAPRGQIVDLRIAGTRNFDSKVLVGEGTTSVTIQHRGYGLSVAGLVLMGVAVFAIHAGVTAAQRGDESSGRTWITLGASFEASGVIMILSDLFSTHNHAVVVEE
jgi:hypothetical protein